MQLATREVYDVLVVDMSGKLDSTTAGDISDQMMALAKGNCSIVLNLGDLSYVSSAGLRVILTASKLLRQKNGELKLCNANSGVDEVLKISGFNSLLKVYDTEKDAVAAFSSN